MSQLVQEETYSLILHRDSEKKANIKQQIELLLNYSVKTVRNKEERQNRYLVLLKYLFCYTENLELQDILKMEINQEEEFALLLKKHVGESNVNATKFIAFCRKILFLEAKEINWEANDLLVLRYSEKNHIDYREAAFSEQG